MAEQTVNIVASAVAGDLVGRALSALMGRLGRQATADEKLQRLEMLLIRIHSAVKVSEKHNVQNAWLVQWRDKLKEAASEGDQVLAVFRQRAMDAQALPREQQGQGGASSSSSSSNPTARTAAAPSPSALSLTTNAVSGMVQGIRNTANMLFRSDEDTKKLNAAVEKLEKLSPNIWEFIRLLQLEILPTVQRSRRTKRKRLPPPPLLQLDNEMETTTPLSAARPNELQLFEAVRHKNMCDNFYLQLEGQAETPEYSKDYQVWTTLLRRLTMPVTRIEWAVWMAAERDMEDSEELAQWAAVLEGALQRARVVHSNVYHHLSRYHYLIYSGQDAQCAHTTDEVESLVSSLEMLAGDVECFGSFLVLCPWDPLTGSSGYCLLGQYQFSRELPS